MFLVLWLVGLALSVLTIMFVYKKIELVKLLAIGTGVYFSMYILVSGILIWIDVFSIMRSLVITICVFILAAVIYIFGYHHKPARILPAVKKYVPLIAVLIGTVIISCMNRSELFPTGQDQGLYQMKAEMYMCGFNSNELCFDEYDNLLHDGERAVYISKLDEMDGIYLTYDTDEYGHIRPTYQIHGVGTFAALLALWGKMFGLANMSGVLVLMNALTVVFAWIVCDNLKIKRYLSTVVSILMTLCPILIWCSRNILTEIVLSMLIALFFVFITDNLKKRVYGLSVIPVLSICYFHISATVIVPLFILIYLYLYIFEYKKSAFALMAVTLIGYVTGLKMMYTSAGIYTSKNMIPLFNKTKNLLNDSNFFGFVLVLSIVFLLIIGALELFGVTGRIRKSIKRIRKEKKRTVTKALRIAMIFIIILLVGLFVYLSFKTVRQGNDVIKMTIMSFIIMTGYVIFPIAFLGMAIGSAKLFKNPARMSIVISLLYIIVVYAAVIWRDIYYYYYYARYFAPYMILIFVAAAMILDYFSYILVIPVCLVSAFFMIYNNQILYTNQDMTYGDLEIVESIQGCVDSKDAVILMDDAFSINKMLMLPVKAATGADIYFLDSNYTNELNNLTTLYEDVYLLGYDMGFSERAPENWKQVYFGVLHTSTYDGLEVEKLPIPTTVTMFDSPFALYLYKGLK